MKHSAYMHWSKMRPEVKYDLGLSGVIAYPLEKLELKKKELVVTGQSMYGFEPLQHAIATRYGVGTDQVVAANGCSGANMLALATLVSAGDQVVMEFPVYDPILSSARFLNAELVPFVRRPENGWRIDPDEISSKVSDRTRLIVLTNLHNPSGVYATLEELKAIGTLAQRVGAHVLVDEVYLGTLFEDEPASSVHLGPEFVVTNSLTKSYGLAGLRCGWILAAPGVAERMWRLNDLFGVSQPFIAERLGVIAFEEMPRIAKRARKLLRANRRLLQGFLETREDLDFTMPEYGTTIFPRLRRGNVDELADRLREKFDTQIVPGRFFGMPDHFRVGICGATEAVAGGLERLGQALDEL